jgi:DNA-directed RNA polymerase III subunit RPC1
VFHIGYLKTIISTLQCICKSCARILLPEDERKQILRKMRNPRIEVLQRRAVLKKVIDRCKRVRNCLWCGDYNGVVKKLAQPPIKLIHDKYAKAVDLREEMVSQLEDAMKFKPELKSCLSRVYDNLDPLRVLGLFEAMVAEVRVMMQHCMN